MRIGSRTLRNNLFVAPMAGVTDRPFRQLCKKFGAGLAVSEMVASNSLLWGSEKTRRRANHEGEVEPISVQIAGADPDMMAAAALLKDEPLVGRILKAVVKAVNVPVTLKFRTGWDTGNKNALMVAKIAEDSGVQLLSLHGRTRACGFSGRAEYDTIREVKRSTRLPVVANGDITTPEEAKHVLEYTGADGIMIGRAAQGRPWIFREIWHYLSTGEKLPHPLVSEIHAVLLAHLHKLYAFYGRETGVKVARKHISWYTKGLAGSASFRHQMNQLETCEEQLDAVNRFFEQFGRENLRLRYEVELAA